MDWLRPENFAFVWWRVLYAGINLLDERPVVPDDVDEEDDEDANEASHVSWTTIFNGSALPNERGRRPRPARSDEPC